jgi:hypothetical protein
MLVGGAGIGGVALGGGLMTHKTGAAILGAAAIALSVTGFIVSKTKCFGDKSSVWIGAGLSLSGGLCAAGGAELLGATSKLGGAAKVGLALSATATVVGGAGQTVSGAGTISRTVYQHQAELAEVDVAEAQAHAQREARQIQRLSDLLREINESHRRALEALQGAEQARHDAAAALIRHI